ncbi:MGMT family protein [uncultured Alsobacter sp.]|uniref:MGMT family protein n=1 Tax=uncultured Alsobacter sp. TaxID=1748258 RepID=UPI0025E1CD44|nr:MGMT family protein [uncultured Alsobacter sp.]
MSRGSPAFARMRRALLDGVRRIPEGRVVEAAQMGEALNIPARHVAYMLSQLAPEEAELVPWHRVIPADGDFGKADRRTARQIVQVARLSAEGLTLQDGRRLTLRPDLRWEPDDTHRGTFWAEEP